MKYTAPKNSRSRSRILNSRTLFVALAAVALLALVTTSAFMAPPLTGAIFTTTVLCDGTNVNIFTSKDAVYLDGGPAHPGAAGLPDGAYYVKVTEPDGTLLGTSVGSADPTPVDVVSGEFMSCYQLSAILIKASDSTSGYDDTSNGGGEYKVWISPTSDFDQQKTDNFKVKPSDVVQQGALSVIKFYDANANGVNDAETQITGWKVRIQDGIDLIRFTPTTVIVAPDAYIVSEFTPAETNWVQTTANPVNINIANGDAKTVEFGNLCLGAGGGKTLGFWSNKNGQATMNDGGTLCPELTLLNNLCLRNASGGDADFACNYTTFRNWLLSANATNMAYMLSAQLAAMKLNIEAGNVSPGALIYAPGTPGANGLGFNTVANIVAAAEAELCAHGYTPSGDPNRALQEAIKNALDNANNNTTFVQPTPCPFTF